MTKDLLRDLYNIYGTNTNDVVNNVRLETSFGEVVRPKFSILNIIQTDDKSFSQEVYHPPIAEEAWPQNILNHWRRHYRENYVFPDINELYNRMPGTPPRVFYADNYTDFNRQNPGIKINLPGYDSSRSKPGWLLQELMYIEPYINGRYTYWQDIWVGNNYYQDIPQLKIDYETVPLIDKIFMHCLDQINFDWNSSNQSARNTINYFLDWILWSLGHKGFDFPGDFIPGDLTHNKLCQIFSMQELMILLLWPGNHLEYFIYNLFISDFDEVVHSSEEEVKNIIHEIFPVKHGDNANKLVVDVNSDGNFLLESSNHTHCLLSFASDPLIAKARLITMYLYIPWAVFPFTDYSLQPDWENNDELFGRIDYILSQQGLSLTDFASIVDSHKEIISFKNWNEFSPVCLYYYDKTWMVGGDDPSGKDEQNILLPANEEPDIISLLGTDEQNILLPADEEPDIISLLGTNEPDIIALLGADEQNILLPADEEPDIISLLMEQDNKLLPGS